MIYKITMIDDSRESIFKFLKSITPKDTVELQAISVDPFFNDEIEQAIKSFDPDLIILDLHLKRDAESGFYILMRLKMSVPLRDVPVVVCSKYIGRNPDDPYGLRAIEMGAVAALPKMPFPTAQDFLNLARKREHDS